MRPADRCSNGTSVGSEKPVPHPLRKIIHIDMDAFFASVEQLDQPQLRGRPVVVGGNPDGRGVVATASYEARRFGIHSAMPAARARRLCPDAVFVRPRFDRYQEITSMLHEIFRTYTSKVEPLSLDEAYLDVTENRAYRGSATRIANHIRADIRTRTGLTASAGVSYNKLLAKLASDAQKPDGLTVVVPDHALEFLRQLPVRRLPGVGPATGEMMRRLGIAYVSDLQQQSLESLLEHFGKAGHWYYQIARGVDERPVTPHRVRKSLGCEHTFQTDLQSNDELLQALEALVCELAAELDARHLGAYTLTLKIKYRDFTQRTRSTSVQAPLLDAGQLRIHGRRLLARCRVGAQYPVRLLGLSVSNLIRDPEALPRQAQLDFGPCGLDTVGTK